MKTLIIALAPILLLAAAFMGYNAYKSIPEPENAAIEIVDAYAFSTMPGAITGAVFMQIKNKSDVDDKLITASTSLAEINEIHENLIDPDDGTMMMRKIKNIELSSGDSATLKPKGKHIMLIKLKEPLTMGSKFPITLTFEQAGVVVTDVQIVAPGTSPKDDKHFGHNH